MLDFIVNPSAGGKQGKKINKCLSLVETRLKERKVDYRIHHAEQLGQTTELTKRLISDGATDLVIMGGDGTLHAAINGFHSFDKVNMGIIACGTGNDFATAIGIPQDPVKAVDIIIDGTAKHTDFMQMPGVRGLNVIGMGIDVDVLKRYESLKKKTKFGYTSCLIKTLFKFDYIDFDAELNGNVEHHNSFIAAVANGDRFGGGLKICPKADPADGKLDFIAVKAIKKLAMIGAFIKLKAGKLLTLKQTTHKTTEKITVKTDIPYTVNVDGELYDGIPFEIEVVSNTLKIYRP